MLAAVALIMELSATLDVADRTELRVRGAQATPVGFDVLNAPLARVSLHDREQLYWLGYTPSFTVSDLQSTDLRSTLIFQTGSAGGGWQLSRQLRLTVTEDATYGQQNFAFLSTPGAVGVTPTAGAPTPPVTPTPTTQVVPSSTTIDVMASRSAIAASAQLSRRWSFVVTASEVLGGGANTISRNNVPFQRTERLELGVQHTLTRVDSLTTTAAVSRLDFAHFSCDPLTGFPVPAAGPGNGPQCNPNGELAEGEEAWFHRLGRLTDVTVAAGAVLFSGRVNDASADATRVYSTASVILHRQLQGLRPAAGSLTLTARLAPIVDLRTGRFDERTLVDLQVEDRSGPWRGQATLSAAQTVPPTDENATSLFAGAVEGAYALTKRFDVGAGARAAWQSQRDLGAFYAVTVFGFFTYHEPTMLLW